MAESKPLTTSDTSKTHQTEQPHRETNPAANTAEAEIAKSNAVRADILAQQVERESWMPTPTQEENDAAAMGQQVEKKADGSPVEETAEQQMDRQREARKAEGKKPEHKADHKAEHDTRHMEGKKPEGGGSYTTRS